MKRRFAKDARKCSQEQKWPKQKFLDHRKILEKLWVMWGSDLKSLSGDGKLGDLITQKCYTGPFAIDYEESFLPLGDSQAKRTRGRERKSPPAWKRDSPVPKKLATRA